ncbi:MAG: OmpH family outer membrane protein [Desulfatiglandaceae bacterium]
MYFRSRNALLIVVFSFLIQSCFLVSDSEAKVGYINLQRLVTESKLGQDARAVIKGMRQEKENEVLEKMQEIKLMQSQFEIQRSKMTLEAQREKIAEIQKANKEYKRLVADSKEDIAREDRELVAIILEKADGVLREVAKRRKFTIILKDPNVLAFLDEKVDITDEVIKELNAQ